MNAGAKGDEILPLPIDLTRTEPEPLPRRRSRRNEPGADAIALGWPGKPADGAHSGTWISSADEAVGTSPILRKVETFGDRPESLLIHGDALHALAAVVEAPDLRATYENKVRLCYIDPPFNTGESFVHYDDKQTSAAWLSMFHDRLRQIRRVLDPQGSIWVHLDDGQQHRARCVLDEVFGADAFVATIIWQKRTSRDNRKAFSAMHDYIHVYSPAGPLVWKRTRNAMPDEGAFTNPDADPRGPWRSVPLTAQSGHGTASQFYTVVSPTGVEHDPPPGRCWTYTRQRFEQLVADGRVYWPRRGDGKPRLKRYQSEASGLAPFTIWSADEVGENASSKKALMAAFPDGPAFDTPKPEALLERIIHIATNPGDVVLDCFLGSGTTAAVAQRMGRKWLGVERSEEIVKTFVVPRLLGELHRSPERRPPGFSLLRVVAAQAPGAALRA